MLREPIEDKIKEKTAGRDTMREFLEKILENEAAGKQFSNFYRSAAKTAVRKEEQGE